MKKFLTLLLLLSTSNFLLAQYNSQITGSISPGATSNYTGLNIWMKRDTDGAAIYIQGSSSSSLNISGSSFSNNQATRYAGAVYIKNLSSFSITDSLFSNNTANDSAGAINIDNVSTVGITNTKFISNSAARHGASLRAQAVGHLTMQGTLFSFNTNAGHGSVDFWDVTNITVISTKFYSNISGLGGGLHIDTSDSVRLENNVFVGNTASTNGGAISAKGVRSFSITDSYFTNNKVTGSGGVAYGFGGAINLESVEYFSTFNSVFTKNESFNSRGGAIFGNDISELLISGSSFIENKANHSNIGAGGAVYLANVDNARIEGSLFEKNSAYSGGALYVHGKDITISRTVFRENSAINSAGAIYLQITNKAIIEDSQFINNTSGTLGGAVVVWQDNVDIDVSFVRTLFSGNKALSPDGSSRGNNGGAIYFYPSVNLSKINDSTFENNKANNFGGAIYSGAKRLEIHNSIFNKNNSVSNGGAIYFEASSSTNTLVISTSSAVKELVWSGNRANGKANSIHFGGAGDSKFELDIAQNTVFKLEDPISSESRGSLVIEKKGKGKFKIGGNSVLKTDVVNLNVIDGSLEIIEGGHFDFSGTSRSSILIGENAELVFVLNTNSKAIFIGNGFNTSLEILSTKETKVEIEKYTKINENIVFPIASNVSGINIKNKIAVNNALYKYNLNFDNNDVVMELIRVHANEIMPGINDYLGKVLDNYMGGNKLIESILRDTNPVSAQNSLITASELTKSAGILYANRLISGAIDYELMYAINSKQALDQSASMFGNIPISLWFTPLVLIGEYSDNVTTDGLKGGNNINSYGGIVAADIALPVIFNMRIGVAGYFGVGFSKSTGVYVNTKNDLMYFGGSLYYNLSEKNFRFNTAISWIGMNNDINQNFGEILSSTFISQNINASFILAYDFIFIKNLFLSPFFGTTYTFYSQPDFESKNIDEVIFSTKKASRHNFVLPIGLSLSYNFLLKNKNIISPSLRVNANIGLYDSKLKAKWGIPTSVSGLTMTEGEIVVEDEIGLVDMNFNLSWRRSNMMVYGDYNFRFFSDRISHFISGGLRMFF